MNLLDAEKKIAQKIAKRIKVSLPIVTGRLVGLIGLFAAGGVLEGLVPGKAGVITTAIATAVVAAGPSILQPSGLVRPVTDQHASVLGAALAATASAASGAVKGAFGKAMVTALADPAVATQITGMFAREQLAQPPAQTASPAVPIPDPDLSPAPVTEAAPVAPVVVEAPPVGQ